MPDELFDVIDEEDNVIGQEMRSVVHQNGVDHPPVKLADFIIIWPIIHFELDESFQLDSCHTQFFL